MPMSPAQFRAMPLFRGISDEPLAQLTEIFERLELDADTVVFESNSPAEYVYLLERGEIEVREGDKVQFRVHPPSPIGELGGLTGTRRITTAVTTQPSTVLRVTREALMQYFQGHGEVAVPFYQNLITVVTHKVRRDQRRVADMRQNLISTQKAMKELRDYLLESPDTPVSEKLHSTLDELIRRNRRVNYRVSPPEMLGSQMRLDSGRSVPVVEISRTHASFHLYGRTLPKRPGDSGQR
jgi:CRP/FNR family cyclic AMP-dependent transcriptional regulator